MAAAEAAGCAQGARGARHRSEAAGRAAGGAANCWNALGVPFARQTAEVFEGCDLIVLSPDVPADLPPLEAARRARRAT